MSEENVFDHIQGVTYHFSKDGLLEDWREEALRHREEILQLKSQLQQKENIIKEVRKYIESYNLPKDLGVLGEAPISISELKHILEILDKENKGE